MCIRDRRRGIGEREGGGTYHDAERGQRHIDVGKIRTAQVDGQRRRALGGGAVETEVAAQ